MVFIMLTHRPKSFSPGFSPLEIHKVNLLFARNRWDGGGGQNTSVLICLHLRVVFRFYVMIDWRMLHRLVWFTDNYFIFLYFCCNQNNYCNIEITFFFYIRLTYVHMRCGWFQFLKCILNEWSSCSISTDYKIKIINACCHSDKYDACNLWVKGKSLAWSWPRCVQLIRCSKLMSVIRNLQRPLHAHNFP